MTFIKDPQAVLDYAFDWSAWLAADETITTATVTVPTPSTLTVNGSTHTDSVVTAWLGGGTVAMNYPVTCHITTSQGRQDDRTIGVKIQER